MNTTLSFTTEEIQVHNRVCNCVCVHYISSKIALNCQGMLLPSGPPLYVSPSDVALLQDNTKLEPVGGGLVWSYLLKIKIKTFLKLTVTFPSRHDLLSRFSDFNTYQYLWAAEGLERRESFSPEHLRLSLDQ